MVLFREITKNEGTLRQEFWKSMGANVRHAEAAAPGWSFTQTEKIRPA